MMTVLTVKREIEKLKQHTHVKPRKIITVYMWTPDGEDPPYNGGPIQVKALKEERKCPSNEVKQNG